MIFLMFAIFPPQAPAWQGLVDRVRTYTKPTGLTGLGRKEADDSGLGSQMRSEVLLIEQIGFYVRPMFFGASDC